MDMTTRSRDLPVPGGMEDMETKDYQGTGHVRIRHLESKEISQEDIDRILQLTGQLEKFERYIVDIVYATRKPEDYGLEKMANLISYGASPRASISLAMASKAYAFIKRRGYVIPEDVRAVCYEVLRHRIGLTYEAEAENMTTDQIISEIINAVEVP
jgi:MoxR-like ATPase